MLEFLLLHAETDAEFLCILSRAQSNNYKTLGRPNQMNKTQMKLSFPFVI